jgi:acyl carrier protein
MQEQTERKIEKIIMELLGLQSVPDNTADFNKDLGCDSLDAVEILMDCEKEFDIRVADEDAERIRTVQDMKDIIADRLGES